MNEIDELKRLLLGQELESVKKLEDRVADPGLRAQDVAEILPDSIALGVEKNPRLIRALEQPVSECLKQSIRKDTKMFADALFPVMGPAIRKAIAEALKSFSDAINQAMDLTFSAKGLRWRWESIRTGVPFSQVVLKHTLLYRVDQAFLIHRETGLLIDHAAQPDVAHSDNDAVSGMFTAIQDFVRDSFSTGANSDLDSVDIGEQTVWLIHGPYAMLACVISGVAPRELRQRFKEVLEHLHQLYGRQLEEFDGDARELTGVEHSLDECLTLQLKHDAADGASRKKPFPVLWVILGVIGLLLIAWWLFDYLEMRRFNNLRAEIDDAPGIVLVRADKRGGEYVVKGLRDPLALDPKQLAAAHGFEAEEIMFDMAPYQSVDTAIILERARRLLSVPDTVNLSLDDTVLKLSGSAPLEWISKYANTVLAIAGIDAINLDDVQPDSSNLDDVQPDSSARNEQLLKQLAAPGTIKVVITGNNVELEGLASLEWIHAASASLKAANWVQGVDAKKLKLAEADAIYELAQRIGNVKIYFSNGSIMQEDANQTLRDVAEDIKTLSEIARKTNLNLKIKLIGHADSVGNSILNTRLREQRASAVLTSLLSQHLDADLFTLVVGDEVQQVQQINPQWRRVDFEVNVGRPNIQALFAK